MSNIFAIISGEPDSINSEIIAKAWKKKKLKNTFIIGNYSILKKQIKKLNIKVPIIKIDNFKDFKKQKKLLVLDVPLKSKSLYKFSLPKVKKYILSKVK